MIIKGNTDIGKVRSANEDSFDFGTFDDGAAWAVVCDGMGGVRGGQIASALATEMISDKIRKCYNKLMPVYSFENIFLSTITTANVIVNDRSYTDTEFQGMGTTIAAAIVKDNQACIAHVGDSRVYKITSDGITQITKDHSLAQEMLDSGQITQEEFENYPKKNIITRALGIEEKIEIDFDFTDIFEGEALLLCSDGLSGLLSEEELFEIYKSTDFELLCDEYIMAANEKGGFDNITAVVMKG
ncbi:MAG: Stp1/IreP family PP2C-type Ser/Thr phosphatase [Clostridia bacterium]|nr:Stp1/IreP family PP2C-type Ser/Thr phosphatase [Clostridia bacterium]